MLQSCDCSLHRYSKPALSDGTANGALVLVQSLVCAAGCTQVAENMPGWSAHTELHTAAMTFLPVSPSVNLKLAQVCLRKLQLGCDCSIKIHPPGDHGQTNLQRKCLTFAIKHRLMATFQICLTFGLLFFCKCSHSAKVGEGFIYPILLSWMVF